MSIDKKQIENIHRKYTEIEFNITKKTVLATSFSHSATLS
jgi:hypothetical protein